MLSASYPIRSLESISSMKNLSILLPWANSTFMSDTGIRARIVREPFICAVNWSSIFDSSVTEFATAG
jgi:hypothetical protein